MGGHSKGITKYTWSNMVYVGDNTVLIFYSYLEVMLCKCSILNGHVLNMLLFI